MEATVNTAEQEVIDRVQGAFGFVPNLFREMAAHNPAVTNAYLDANGVLEEGGVLTGPEQQVVILAISTHNDCHYCTKAHSVVGKMVGLSEETVQTITDGGLPQDERQRNLVKATRRLAGKHGWLSADDLQEFESNGIDRAQTYEIIALIGFKTITNYINHIAHTEVDAQFK